LHTKYKQQVREQDFEGTWVGKSFAPPPFKSQIFVSESFLVPKSSDIGYTWDLSVTVFAGVCGCARGGF